MCSLIRFFRVIKLNNHSPALPGCGVPSCAQRTGTDEFALAEFDAQGSATRELGPQFSLHLKTTLILPVYHSMTEGKDNITPVQLRGSQTRLVRITFLPSLSNFTVSSEICVDTDGRSDRHAVLESTEPVYYTNSLCCTPC